MKVLIDIELSDFNVFVKMLKLEIKSTSYTIEKWELSDDPAVQERAENLKTKVKCYQKFIDTLDVEIDSK